MMNRWLQPKNSSQDEYGDGMVEHDMHVGQRLKLIGGGRDLSRSERRRSSIHSLVAFAIRV